MMAKVSMLITAIKFIWEITKGVRDLVKLVEEDDIEDGEKHGEKKKEAIMEIVEAVYDVANNNLDIPLDKESVLGLADTLIETFVKFYNAIGKFRSKSN